MHNIFIAAFVTTAASIAGSLLLLFAIRWAFPHPRFPRSDEAVSTVSLLIGTVYAVMLAFMLYTVWTQFQTAEATADREAQAMVNLHYLAGQLPEPHRSNIRRTSEAYVKLVVADEWDRMPKGEMSRVAFALLNKLWQASTAVEASTLSDRVLFDHILTELSAASESRRLRMLSLHRRLAPILWVVLVVGGVLTLATLCLLNMPSASMHALKVGSSAAFLCLMLFAVYQLDSPFGGSLRLPADAFRLAAGSFEQFDDAPRAASARPPGNSGAEGAGGRTAAAPRRAAVGLRATRHRDRGD